VVARGVVELLRIVRGMNRRPLPDSPSSPSSSSSSSSSSVQWLNRRGMGVRTGGDGAVSLCQKALQVVTELCLSGHVDREKCAYIFPLESTSPGKGHAGKSNKMNEITGQHFSGGNFDFILQGAHFLFW